LLSLGSISQAGAGHGLAQAALLHEGLFQGFELAVEEEIGHFDEANDDIGADGRVGVFDAFSSAKPCRRASASLRRQTGLL
jgi:hypothetical protein